MYHMPVFFQSLFPLIYLFIHLFHFGFFKHVGLLLILLSTFIESLFLTAEFSIDNHLLVI
jgi:hypothetical protein